MLLARDAVLITACSLILSVLRSPRDISLTNSVRSYLILRSAIQTRPFLLQSAVSDFSAVQIMYYQGNANRVGRVKSSSARVSVTLVLFAVRLPSYEVVGPEQNQLVHVE